MDAGRDCLADPGGRRPDGRRCHPPQPPDVSAHSAAMVAGGV